MCRQHSEPMLTHITTSLGGNILMGFLDQHIEWCAKVLFVWCRVGGAGREKVTHSYPHLPQAKLPRAEPNRTTLASSPPRLCSQLM